MEWLSGTNQTVFLFGLSFANAVFFPIGPEVAFVPILLVNHHRLVPCAFSCVAGSVAGLMLTYFLSFFCGRPFADKYVPPDKFASGVRVYARYGPWALVIASMFPVFPYRMLVIVSGFLRQKPSVVLFFLTLGKALRFFGYGFLIIKAGKFAAKFIF